MLRGFLHRESCCSFLWRFVGSTAQTPSLLANSRCPGVLDTSDSPIVPNQKMRRTVLQKLPIRRTFRKITTCCTGCLTAQTEPCPQFGLIKGDAKKTVSNRAFFGYVSEFSVCMCIF
ncbi:hypothetical protein AGOR_G00006530 [Albula goreensis]|uniref:Uncharacterized protein n=1 Tax=Albula goreensis TaxID=1534307 RepID=A0A8T3E8U4_9TELE|nr:hypothetical protein AGOR_G00006530 [Albula goreensis]